MSSLHIAHYFLNCTLFTFFHQQVNDVNSYLEQLRLSSVEREFRKRIAGNKQNDGESGSVRYYFSIFFYYQIYLHFFSYTTFLDFYYFYLDVSQLGYGVSNLQVRISMILSKKKMSGLNTQEYGCT